MSEQAFAELARESRAGIAQLALALRAALEEADDVERAGPTVDVAEARALIVTSVAHRLATRRVELGQEVEQARINNAAMIGSAQAEGAAIVAAANGEVIGALLGDVAHRAVPHLRIVNPAASHPFEAHVAADTSIAGRPEETRVITTRTAPQIEPFPTDLTTPAGSARPDSPTVNVSSQFDSAAKPVSPAGRHGLGRYLYADVVLPIAAVLVLLVILLLWIG